MSGARPWLPHLACLALLLAQVGAYLALHRSEAELEAAAAAGPPRERIAALHVLANRGEPPPERFGHAFVEELLASDEPLLRDYAFTTDVCKHAEPRAQYQAVKTLTERPDDPEFWRAFVLHRRKVGVALGGSSARLRLEEFLWYRAALAGRELPGERLLVHIEQSP